MVATVPWPRNERSAVAGLKTTSYAENVVALAHAQERGAAEALMPNTHGQLCEGTGSNVFVVREGVLLDSTATSGCLPGITRDLVIEWYGGEERELPMEAWSRRMRCSPPRRPATSSRWNRSTITRCRRPGEITARVQEVFMERSAADLDPETLDP